MKYSLIFFTALLLSCTKKDNNNCYICKTTWIVTTDVPVSGFPATTTSSVELCDLTSDELSAFEEANTGSETSSVNNVTYSGTHSTVCTHK